MNWCSLSYIQKREIVLTNEILDSVKVEDLREMARFLLSENTLLKKKLDVYLDILEAEEQKRLIANIPSSNSI